MPATVSFSLPGEDLSIRSPWHGPFASVLTTDRLNSESDLIRGRDARATMGTREVRVVDGEESVFNDAIRFLGQGHDSGGLDPSFADEA